MAKEKLPATAAIRALREAGIEFSAHPYNYEEHGGTEVCARELKVDQHSVVKTLIMEDEKKQPLVVLMHGDRKVSTKELARAAGVKTIMPCAPDVASRHTGYMVGGTSPFGLRRLMPIYMERTILALPRMYVNGGRRGLLVGMNPRDAVALLKPTLVAVAIA